MARLTRVGIERTLLAGAPVKWLDGNGKEQRFALDSSEQRRLFAYVLGSRVREPKGLSTEFIIGLAKAYDAQEDPASNSVDAGANPSSSGPWRLQHIDATGFGGLNTWGGKAFSFGFNQESLLIEGPNGSGKSSLVGAIIWSLTGERPRDYANVRAHEARAVYTETDKSAGSWPPIACYPPTAEELNSQPHVRVGLTFINSEGESATIVRTLKGERLEVVRSQGAEIPEILLETGILMPARLAQIRLREGQGQLTDAVKKLTGLDELSEIGALADGLCHRGREYLSYARSQSLHRMKVDFDALLDKARKALEPVSVTVRAFNISDTEDSSGPMVAFGKELIGQAASLTKIIAEDLAPGLDLTEAKTQQAIARSIQRASEMISCGFSALPTWQFLESLVEALEDRHELILASIGAARRSMADAVAFHERSRLDSRLRLKATAAQWHAENVGSSVRVCPLCDQSLDSRKSLVAELEDLQGIDEAAGRSFRDNINAVSAALITTLPEVVRSKSSSLLGLQPHVELLKEVRSNLFPETRDESPLRRFIDMVDYALGQAPVGTFRPTLAESSDAWPEDASGLVEQLAIAETALSLAVWFRSERENWKNWWRDLTKTPLETTSSEEGADSLQVGGKVGSSPLREGLLPHLARLSQAVDAATPYRIAANAMRSAWKLGKDAARIEKEQIYREKIAEALSPLKNLSVLADSVARQAIAELSTRISSILETIHLSDRFHFYSARLERKEGVVVRGGFAPELRIDATLVAKPQGSSPGSAGEAVEV